MDLEVGRCARGEDLGRLGEMGVAIDDPDAFEQRVDALQVRGVVSFLDHAARHVRLFAPIALGGVVQFGGIGFGHGYVLSGLRTEHSCLRSAPYNELIIGVH